MRVISIFMASWTLLAAAAAFADWPQFRGPHGGGLAIGAKLPVTWGAAEGDENVSWRRELPGRGPSSPIVVAGKVIVTCSSGVHQDRLHVLCFDGRSGERLWERQFWATGRTLTHPTSAGAAPTPASDGRAIFAFFSSNDLACLELDGTLRWYRGLGHDYPKAGNDVGMASSPVVIGETVIVQVEAQGDSFAAGIDTQTGETRWRLNRRPEASWSSPTVLPREAAGRDVALLQSPFGLTAVDAHRGAVLWEHAAPCSGISSPLVDGTRVYVPSGGMTALDVAAGGESATVAWQSPRLNPGAGSAVAHAGRIYAINNSGVLVCGDATTGEVLWQLRLEGRCWATPIITGERLYAVNSDGKAFVVELGEKGEIVGKSDFGEGIQGTPAVAGDALLVRSDGHLWKIASGKAP
jgi:outer membrane protein assembly factor BamB